MSICVGSGEARHFSVGYFLPRWPPNSWLLARSVKLREMTRTGSGRQLIGRVSRQYKDALGRQVEKLQDEEAGSRALARSSRSRLACNLTELAQAFSTTTARLVSRCVRCRAAFGYSWSVPECCVTQCNPTFFEVGACAEYLMYLGCLDARKRHPTRREGKKKRLVRRAKGWRRRRRTRSRRC